MITLQDTTLTAQEYAAIKANAGFLAQNVTTQRRNLSFSVYNEDQPAADILFDALLIGTDIVKVYIASGNLYSIKLASGSSTWSAPTQLDTGVSSVRPSMAGTRVFYVKDDALYYTTSAGGGSPVKVADSANTYLFNDGITIGGNITHVGAGSETVFFAAVYRPDYNTHMLGFMYYSGAWHTFDSDVYLPHQLDGFDAAQLGSGAHVIALVIDLPPLIGQKVVGSKLSQVAERRSGILTFRFQNKRFSDHFLVDVYDNASDYQYRNDPRLTFLPNNRLVLSVYGRDGKSIYNHACLHYYFSTDGKAWEQDQLLYRDDASKGGVFVERSGYTYLITETKTHRSYTTELTGTTHADLVLNLTNRITAYSTDQSPVRSSTFVMKNNGNWIDTTGMKTGQWTIDAQFGLWLNGTAKLFKLSHELIDVIAPSREKPSQEVVIKTRDFTALISGSVKSPQPREYETQVVGADKFYNFTDTDYGGLTHTAAVDGSWTTKSNFLSLKSNNKRGAAWNTFKTDALWNGIFETALTVEEPTVTPDSSEEELFGGIVCRAYDKDNYLVLQYQPVSDKLGLYQMRAGVKTHLTSLLNMGWVYGTTYYLRLVFHYSKLNVDTSLDGHTWTPRFAYMLPGQEPGTDPRLAFEDGMVGYSGLDYSQSEDVYPEVPTNDDQGSGLPGDLTGYGNGTKSGILYLRGELGSDHYCGIIVYTRNASAGPWILLHGGLETTGYNNHVPEIANGYLDPWNPDHAYVVLQNGSVYYNTTWMSGGNWDKIVDGPTLLAQCRTAWGLASDAPVKAVDAVFSMAAEGYVYIAMLAGANMDGDPAVVRVRRLQNAIDISPLAMVHNGDYANGGAERPQIYLGGNNPNFVCLAAEKNIVATGEQATAAFWAVDWTKTGTDWGDFPLSTGFWRSTLMWSPRWTQTHVPGDYKNCNPFIGFYRIDGAKNVGEDEIFLNGVNGQTLISQNKGYSFQAWSWSGQYGHVLAEGPNIEGHLDSFATNGQTGNIAYFIQNSFSDSVADTLSISIGATEAAGHSYTTVPLPFYNQVGWMGGYPSNAAQFYIGASQFHYNGFARQNGKDKLLYFTSTGGASWSDWKHNIWTIAQPILNNDASKGIGVIRYIPHWLE